MFTCPRCGATEATEAVIRKEFSYEDVPRTLVVDGIHVVKCMACGNKVYLNAQYEKRINMMLSCLREKSTRGTLTYAEAARILAMPVEQLEGLIKSGRLMGFNYGMGRRVFAQDVNVVGRF